MRTISEIGHSPLSLFIAITQMGFLNTKENNEWFLNYSTMRQVADVRSTITKNTF